MATMQRQCINKDCADWKKVVDIDTSWNGGCSTCQGDLPLKSDIDQTEAERLVINPGYVKNSMPYGFENEGHT